jgi:hypothetical protein
VNIRKKKENKKMKKAYEAPKAEKMEFDYSDAVVAASSSCEWEIKMGDTYDGCIDRPKDAGHANDILN